MLNYTNELGFKNFLSFRPFCAAFFAIILLKFRNIFIYDSELVNLGKIKTKIIKIIIILLTLPKLYSFNSLQVVFLANAELRVSAMRRRNFILRS